MEETEPERTKVVFVCPHCQSIYQAVQVPQPTAAYGWFQCENCEAVVHEWTGMHTYRDWQAVK